MASGKTIGNAKENGGLYYFEDGQISSALVQRAFFGSISSSSDQDILLWHFQLGHPSFFYLKQLFPNLFINKDPSSLQCEICALAKHHRSSYPPGHIDHQNHFNSSIVIFGVHPRSQLFQENNGLVPS